jgi:hypothetical protein
MNGLMHRSKWALFDHLLGWAIATNVVTESIIWGESGRGPEGRQKDRIRGGDGGMCGARLRLQLGLQRVLPPFRLKVKTKTL